MILPLLSLLHPAAVVAIPPAEEYQVKATILAKLPSMVEWPAPNPDRAVVGPFIFGVIGKHPFGDELDIYFLEHKIKGRQVKVRYFKRPEDIEACDLLFVCSSMDRQLASILARVRAKPTLTVGDTEGFAKQGVMVNLTRAGDRLEFEANLQSAREAGLVFSKSFLPVIKRIW